MLVRWDRPRRVGFVATRGRMYDTNTSDSTTYSEQTYHFARDDVTGFWAGWGNWYGQGGTGEVLPGSNMTNFRASVSTSIDGPWVHGNVAGSTTWTIGNGDTVYAWFPLALQNGQQFYIRSFRTVTAYLTYSVGMETSGGDAVVFSDTDYTNGGTMTNAGGSGSGPIAIVGYTRRPSVAAVGDSLTQGYDDAPNADVGDTGEVCRYVGQYFGYSNLGLFDEFTTSFISAGSRRRAVAKYGSHVELHLGTNDWRTGSSAATVEKNLTEIYGMFPGQKIFAGTLVPLTSSTDDWATLANQTPLSNEADRVTINTWIRAAGTPVNGWWDIGNVMESSFNSGLWIVPGYVGDGIHPNQTGYEHIATSGCFDYRRYVW